MLVSPPVGSVTPVTSGGWNVGYNIKVFVELFVLGCVAFVAGHGLAEDVCV